MSYPQLSMVVSAPSTLFSNAARTSRISKLRFATSSINRTTLRLQATPTDTYGQPSELADGTWDNLGIDPVPTDYIYIMKSSGNGEFSDGGLQQFGSIDMNPSSLCVKLWAGNN